MLRAVSRLQPFKTSHGYCATTFVGSLTYRRRQLAMRIHFSKNLHIVCLFYPTGGD